MSNTLLQIYHHLPTPARSAAATMRGRQLLSWRYGPETDRLVAEAFERDHWSRERQLAWQQERLASLLERAATQVPYYRKQWAERRWRGDRASWEYLENWPILEKEPIRDDPKAFVATDCDISKMFHEHTSGTTGKSLDLWWSRDTVMRWYALFEARWRLWNGVSRNDKWAILGGQLVTPVRRRKPPFWVWNDALHQLYMSSYHLAPDLIPHYLDALVQHKIKYLWGYTSALHALAQEALRAGRRDLHMAVVITNAEPVFDYQRRDIEEAFQCPLRETYGMSEAVLAASECAYGQRHLWPEVGIAEVMDENGPVPRGISGDLICTGLLNADMPLIRYRIGDRGALPEHDEECECGRSLLTIASVEGRADDILYTMDGRRIGRLDPVFKSHLPVREAQVVQEALDRVRVLYVPAPDYTPQAGYSIIERLRARMGPIEVILEPVDKVPRTSNGKFRAVICNLTPEERKRVQELQGAL